MRKFLLAFATISLAACSQAPSSSNSDAAGSSGLPNHLKEQASVKVQAKLDSDFGSGKATVKSVAIVKTDDAKFDGVAHVLVGEKSIDLPFSGASDGTTTLVNLSDDAIGRRLAQDAEETVASLVGKYSDYVLTPSIFKLLPLATQNNRKLFRGRLQVVSPVQERDGGYFGTGCKAHACTSDTVGWWISRDGKRAIVVLAEWWEPTAYGKSTGVEGSVVWHIFGANINTLPPSLSQWARDIGLSEMNIAGPDIQYRPPGKN